MEVTVETTRAVQHLDIGRRSTRFGILFIDRAVEIDIGTILIWSRIPVD